MSDLPRFKITLQDVNGLYFKATQNTDSTWTVTTSIFLAYIKHLPQNWDGTKIQWQRDMTYMGVFRSASLNYQFSMDARAILSQLWYNGIGGTYPSGVQAYCMMSIYQLQETESSPGAGDMWRYELAYQAEIDFTGAKDDLQQGLFNAATLDSKLYELLKAYASQQYNIPYWVYDSGSATWELNGGITDTVFIQHNGIKLLYQQLWDSGATVANPIDYGGGSSNALGCWKGGNGDGFHNCLPMVQYNQVQNNGSTTFVGNDILTNLLIINDQNNVVNGGNNTFDNVYNSNVGYFLRNLLGADITMAGEIDITTTGIYRFDTTADDKLRFVLIELDQNSQPTLVPMTSEVEYQNVLDIDLPIGATIVAGASYSQTSVITIRNGYYYILCPILDSTVSFNFCEFTITNCQFTLKSNYNSGTASPVPAPIFPVSPTLAMTPSFLLSQLVPALNSTQTDPYGFPLIPSGTPYVGDSDYLSDATIDPATNYDNIPAYTFFTSGNALRLIGGQPFITISLNDFFNTCFKVWSCGLYIDGDAINIEPLATLFDNTDLLLDLGTNVASLQIEQLSDMMGNAIKGGYAKIDTNGDFGIENVWTEQDYITPLARTVKDIDLLCSEVVTDIYTIEKARQQKTNEQITTPSANNGNYLIEVNPTAITPTFGAPETPDGVIYTGSYVTFEPNQLANAQSTDPTAASAPYLNGFYYPETAYNWGVTPAKNVLRNGAWLHSIMDGQEGGYITFRKQYQMQYNNTVLELPGISTNIDAGLVQEVSDIAISSLPDKLFRPFIMTIITNTPVNMYSIMSESPKGYIQFEWKDREGNIATYKGFPMVVTQTAGNSAATEMKLLATPDTIF